ncbi:MAG: glycosyltransferase family 4 protein [Nitrospirota bacterium]
MKADKQPPIFFIKKKFSPYGGAENYLATVMNTLRKHYEITVLAGQWEEAEGIKTLKIPSPKLGSFMSVVSFNRNVCNFLKNLPASENRIVISFERTTCQDIYRAGEGCHAEWLGIRSLTEPWHKKLSFHWNPLHRAILGIEKKLFLNTRFIIANSRMVKNNIMKHYAVPREKISVIYNGVDLNRFHPGNKTICRNSMRKQLMLPPDIKALLFVGSGFERKGLATLIKAVGILKRKDVKVLVAGKGDRMPFESKLKKYGLQDTFIFLGIRKEIEKLYAAADIFVLPTLYDPFSNATLEAMASGLPVLTTGNNGAAELIKNGQEGFVIGSPFDAQELSIQIENTIGNITCMGEKAGRKAAGFPIEKAAAQFMEILDRAQKIKD